MLLEEQVIPELHQAGKMEVLHLLIQFTTLTEAVVGMKGIMRVTVDLGVVEDLEELVVLMVETVEEQMIITV